MLDGSQRTRLYGVVEEMLPIEVMRLIYYTCQCLDCSTASPNRHSINLNLQLINQENHLLLTKGKTMLDADAIATFQLFR